MHPGISDQSGEDCGSFTLIRGKERGRTHSEAMLSSLVHAFRQSSVKTLRRTPVCGSQRPNTTHLWSLHPPAVSSPLPRFCLFPLHYSTSCLCCFCSAPSLSFFLFPSSTVGLICHSPLMARSVHQASSLCVFLLSLASLIFSAALFVSDSDELEGQASPLFVDLGL